MLSKTQWLICCCLPFLLVFTVLSEVQAKQVTQEFSLPPVDGEPYTLQIPVEINQTGVISASVKLQFAGLPNDKTVLAGLYQKNNRYVLTSKYYDPRMQGLNLRHKVDSKELAAGHDYYLSLTNYSHDRAATGEVVISFPVFGEIIKKAGEGPLPNLTITDIRLDEHCKVNIYIKNLGPGVLPTYFWKKNMPTLTMFRDGQQWGAVDIRFFDFKQALSPIGGETVYSCGLKLFRPARIRAIVATGSRLSDADKTDNTKEVVLSCK